MPTIPTMPTPMLGPADITVASARGQDALALAARMRLIDEARAHVSRDPRVIAGHVLMRCGAWLITTVQPMAPPVPAHMNVGGKR